MGSKDCKGLGSLFDVTANILPLPEASGIAGSGQIHEYSIKE
jgi:hypothetical protein